MLGQYRNSLTTGPLTTRPKTVNRAMPKEITQETVIPQAPTAIGDTRRRWRPQLGAVMMIIGNLFPGMLVRAIPNLIVESLIRTKASSREYVMNSRRASPRRVWKVGSGARLLTPLPWDPYV